MTVHASRLLLLSAVVFLGWLQHSAVAQQEQPPRQMLSQRQSQQQTQQPLLRGQSQPEPQTQQPQPEQQSRQPQLEPQRQSYQQPQEQPADRPDRACYQSARAPYVYFSSKTNYGVVAGNDLRTPPENVSLMLRSCKYEKAWYIQSRPAWCAFFTQRDLEIVEYLEDLKYYYQYGYGNPYSESIGCPMVKDLINNFKNQTKDKNGPLGVFYFGHSPNVLSVATQLGVGKENTPLLSTNFEQMRNRKWRSTFIDPFASNVIVVFYKCTDGYKSMYLLNEHAIPMGKEQCLLCPWESIETQFDPIITNNHTCNLNVCKALKQRI